jgi:hypothetical protein
MVAPACIMTPQDTQLALLTAPPAIRNEIIDLTVLNPSWIADLPKIEPFDLGQGLDQQQLIIKGSLPDVERGFSKWKKLKSDSGCEPCEGNGCAYNWTPFKGYGIQRKATEFMSRDFRTDNICVKDVQHTAHFKQMFEFFVMNLYRQIAFHKEQNIAFNFFTMLAKKFVVTSQGPRYNGADIYSYPNLGATNVRGKLAALNIDMMEFLYARMSKYNSAIPFDRTAGGAPMFAVSAEDQILSRVYRDDPSVRQDIRFSSAANDLYSKYNFQNSFRNMFISAPVPFPRRFNADSAGNLTEVFPYINDVPAEAGLYSDLNDAYFGATYEEVLFYGKYPFSISYVPTATTLGEGSTFGPEFAFLEGLQWVNPQTETDPAQRAGFYMTSATIGLLPQYSDSIFAFLVERPSVRLMAAWNPSPTCPPADVTCTNDIPDSSGTPPPLILSVKPNAYTAGHYDVVLSMPTTADTEDVIDLGYATGGYVAATVVQVDASGIYLEVTISETLDSCDGFTTVFCDDTRGCSSAVEYYEPNAADNTRIDLYLSNPIKAASGSVTVYYGNGTHVTATLVSGNMVTLKYIVDIGSSAFADNVGGVVGICVPTGTEATCPACTGPTFTNGSSDCGIEA